MNKLRILHFFNKYKPLLLSLKIPESRIPIFDPESPEECSNPHIGAFFRAFCGLTPFEIKFLNLNHRTEREAGELTGDEKLLAILQQWKEQDSNQPGK